MSDCIFCKIANKEIKGQYIYEDERCVAFLDLSQATYGHTLVVPKTHVKNILEVDEALSAHLFKVTTRLAKHICTTLHAKGCNIITNANEVAGQTVPHFHIHIIPRYNEDEGFKTFFEDHGDQYDLTLLKEKLVFKNEA